MSYFVQVNHTDGSVDRWEHLDQQQANYIYAEQVEIHGRTLPQQGACNQPPRPWWNWYTQQT